MTKLTVNLPGVDKAHTDKDGLPSREFLLWLSVVDKLLRGDFNGSLLSAGSSAALRTLLGVSASASLFHAQDEKASGTSGGTFTSGAWRTRDINTVKTNEVGAIVASNQIALLAGTYFIAAEAPAFYVSTHQARLQNISDAATILVGTSEYSANGGPAVTASRSLVGGRFTLAATKTVELQHQCSNTFATGGFGVDSGFGVVNTYSRIFIQRVG